MKKLNRAWLLAVLLLAPWLVKAQPINITAGNVSGCIGDTVSIPITTSGGTGVGAISLALEYNTQNLSFAGVSNVSTAIAGNLLTNAAGGKVLVSWFGTQPVSLPVGTLLNVRMVVQGSSSLNWDLATAGNCEIADAAGTPLPTTYANGGVGLLGANIVNQPVVNNAVQVGDTAIISVNATGVNSYQWQVLDNGQWVNLQNGGLYVGVNQATLFVQGVTSSLNGRQYRVQLSGSCPLPVLSNPVTLAVGGSQLQGVNLPITWDDPSVGYAFTDFGGNASSYAPSPTNAGNITLRTEKTLGAQTWAGTTLTPSTGLLSPIPFASGSTSISVNVHAPASGIVVRLKAEQAGVPTISVETEATTTTAGWQTLVFNFANQAAGTAPLNFGNTYNLLSIFYDFGNNGNGAVYYADSVYFGGGPVGPPPVVFNLPITWDNPSLNYTFTDFGGTVSGLSPSPTNAANTTLRTEKTVGAQFWAGTTITPAVGLSTPIPFATGATYMSVQVHAPAAGIVVRLKAEQAGAPTISVETDATTTTAGWQTLTFNFTNQVAGTPALNFANTYNMLSIFYDFGNNGNGAVYYADSVYFGGGPVGPPPVVFNLPITWDNPSLNYTFTDFGGTVSGLSPSPTNAANTTLRTEKTVGAQFWAGTTITPAVGLSTPIPFATGATYMSVQVHAPAAGIVVRLKAEQAGAPTISVETDATTTTAGWQTLTFNFTNQVAGTPALNFANTYNMLSIFYDFGNNGNGAVYYADSVYFGGGPVGPPPVVFNLPITWDDPSLNYTFTDFGGTVSGLAPSPTNAANTTLRTEKTVGAQFWAGTTITPVVGLSTPIPFATGATYMSVQVHAPAAGIVVRLKAEQAGAPTISVETDATTTTAGWQTLTFNFANQVAGTPALNFANTYNILSIFYDFGNNGNGAVYYADSVYFGGGPVGPPPVVFNLPITWDDPSLNYTFTDFGGTVSGLAPSPTNTANTTLRTEKTVGAQTWGGTTITPANGLSTPIPFTAAATNISVQVYAPAPGVVVRLKAEQAGVPSISVETEATTTTSGWQTLVFNFANQAAGTAPLNLGNTYNMLSIFYDFGNNGNGAVYYADSVYFGGGPVGPPPVVFNLPITWDNPAVNYTVTDFGGNVSTLAPSPTNATNTTLRTEKGIGAETWAGTTLTPLSGLTSPIPFSATATTIAVQIYAPAAGLNVRLKAEQAGVPTISVETEALTTSVGWQTLAFNFANQAAGTAPLNLANTYNLLAIFYDFGNPGTGSVFFADSVYFGVPAVNPQPVVQIGLPQAVACLGDTVAIPVSHNGINGLAALSMVLQYNAGHIDFVGVSNVQPALSASLLSNAANSKVFLSWFDVNPISLVPGHLFDLQFVVRDGSSLAWDLNTPGNCELADGNGNVIPTIFNDGNIGVIGQSIVDQPYGNTQLSEGDSTVLIVDASGATGYQWQRLVAQQWMDVQNDTTFSGAQTATLAINGVMRSLNGAGFRVLVFGACPQAVISNPIFLNVQGGPAPPFEVSLQAASACLGDTVKMDILVNKFQDIGAISLVLEHPSAFTFAGVRNPNPALNTANLVVTPQNGKVSLAWFDNQPLNMPDGSTLIRLLFVMNGGGAFVWDTQTPGNCEIANSNGVILLGTFNGTSLQPSPAPLIQSQPANRVVAAGDTASFAVIAQNVNSYQWQRLVNGSWLNLSDNAGVVGAQTPELRILASSSLNGSVYRVRLTGNCSGPSFSQAAALQVAATGQVVSLLLPQLTACVNQTITVPINATNFNGVSAFSLSIQYDTTLLQFSGFTPNSAIQNGLVVNGNANGRVRLSWFSVQPVSIGNAVLLGLQFTTRALGQTALTWSNQVQGDNEIADVNGQVMLSNFGNGAVLVNGTSPVITQQPQPQTTAEGGTAAFQVVATNASQYQWQVLTGTQWVNLQNQAPYSGATTATLQINNVTLALNGLQYRVQVNGNCLPGVNSQAAQLTVTPNVSTISVRLGSDSICAGGVVSIPVRVSQFNQIGTFTLRVLYNQNNLQFTGLTGVHGALQSTLASGAANGRVSLSWFGIQALNLGDTTLFNLNFLANGSSTLIWDTVSTGVGVITNTTGNPLPRQFTNGGVTAKPLPNVQFVPIGNVCLNAGAVALQATPAGGTFAGQGVSGSQFNPVLAGLGTHVVTYSYTDPLTGCSNSVSRNITVLPLPLGNAGADQTICLGSSATLSASGGASYLWSTGATTAVINVNPIVTTTYTVRITNAGGCSIVDTVVVNIFNDPSMQAGADTAICLGGSVQLQAVGGLQYFWSPSTGLSANNIANPIASPTVTTQYIVAGLTSSGCVSLDTIVVTVNPRPQANAGADQVVCNGAAVQLQASGGVSYSWSPAAGLSATNIANPTALPTQATDYVVTVTNASGCSSTDTVRVFVPRVLAGSNQNICRGSSVQLQANLVGAPGGAVSYAWSPATGLSATNISNPVASPATTTIYTVTATVGGCSVSGTVAVIINPTPQIDAGLDIAIAPGASIQLNAVATGGLTPYNIQWSPATGLSSAQVLNPTATPTATTRYYLSVAGANGCSVIDSVLVTIDPALLGKNILGKLVYANGQQSPLTPGSVQLRDNQGVLINTVGVDANANYLFQNNADATYQLNGVTTKTWGGVTSADALLINEAFVSTSVITTGPLGLKAADVNDDGAITGVDALLTLQRVVGTSNTFAAGDWVYATDTVVLAGADVQRNVRAMCVGDVNASYDPNLRIMPRVLLTDGTRMGRPATGIEQVQLIVEEGIAVGSYQLELQLHPGDKVVSVNMPNSSMQPVFAQQGDVVRIAWFTPSDARHLQSGDLFLQLQISTGGFGAKGLPFEITGFSEMTNKAAEIYPQVRLRTPVWSPSTITAQLQLQAYPNPMRDQARIVFSIPEAGHVKVMLTDMAGRILEVPFQAHQQAGQYELQWNAGSLTAGMYFVHLEHEINGQILRKQERLIIQK